MKTLTTQQDGKKYVIFEDGKKMAGKENNFLTKTDAENTIQAMIERNPKLYKK